MKLFKAIQRLALTGMVAAAALLGAGTALAVPTLSIDSPTDGSSVDDDYVLVSGVASAVGGGAGIDLMLVLDDSGSLSSTDPTGNRFDAVRQLINSFGPDADVNIGVVFFSSSATTEVSLGPVSSATTSVETAINNHSYPSGGTAIGSGIEAAAAELDASGRSTASQVIVVFTDGDNNSGSDPVSAASAAASANRVVNVVALGTDASYQTNMQAIATAGGGVMLSATDSAQLASLFRSARMVGIQSVTVSNTTTGSAAPVVNVVAGSYSASVDLSVGDNVISVTATDTDGLTTTEEVTVTRTGATVPTLPDRRVKLRPQVLMAGFDPMLVDIIDTGFDIVAVVREGAVSISHVSLGENTGSASVGMTYRGDLANGDKVYSATLILGRGALPAGTRLPNLFGSRVGEFQITAVDASQQTHSFPALEYGNNTDLTAPAASVGTLYSSTGPARLQPQALVVGFDPMLLDYNDTSFKVKAIVRQGAAALQSVALQTSGASFAIAMSAAETLPNGDVMYEGSLTFPRGAFPAGSFEDLFGEASTGEFVVEVTDLGQQTHRFPALSVGNYPAL